MREPAVEFWRIDVITPQRQLAAPAGVIAGGG